MAQTGSLSHLDVSAGDPERSIAFYDALLTALGYHRWSGAGLGGAWQGNHPTRATWSLRTAAGSFGIEVRPAREESRGCRYDRYEPGPHHLAFHAADPATVDRVQGVVEAAGGEILDAAADYSGRKGYSPGYYAAFFADPDGFKIEVAHIP